MLLQLLAHRPDIGPGPFARMDLALHRRILGRHAERVPAHRVEHFVALHPPVAGDDVAHRVIADMAHVDAPRGIGEHLEHVGLGLVAARCRRGSSAPRPTAPASGGRLQPRRIGCSCCGMRLSPDGGAAQVAGPGQDDVLELLRRSPPKPAHRPRRRSGGPACAAETRSASARRSGSRMATVSLTRSPGRLGIGSTSR